MSADQRREQVGALVGQPVALARALPRVPVVLALEQSVLDQLAQPGGGHRLADPDALREVVESGRAVEGLAEDQERRARRDDVERLGDRAAGRRSSRLVGSSDPVMRRACSMRQIIADL